MRNPSIAPLLVWQSLLLAYICGLFAAVWSLPASIAFLLVLICNRTLWRPSRLAATFLVFFCGFAYAGWHFHEAQKQIHEFTSEVPESRFCGRVIKTQGMAEHTLRVFLTNITRENGEHLPGMAIWTWQNPLFTPLAGQTLCMKRYIRPVHGFANEKPNGYETGLIARGIFWRVWSEGDKGSPEVAGEPSFLARARENARRDFIRTLFENGDEDSGDYQARAILLALLFGDKQYLRQSTLDNFSTATLAHSLALSGQHLCVAGLLGLAFIGLAGRCSGRFFLFAPRPLLIALASWPFALAYLWIGNASSSLLRAFAMLSLVTIWIWFGKCFRLSDVLCAALGLILLISPLSVFDVSLQLSALCVAVIIIVAPWLNKLFVLKQNSGPSAYILKRIADLCVLSLFIQGALLPLGLNLFQILGIWFPLNVLWLPVLGLFVLPMAFVGLILACSAFPFMQSWAPAALGLASAPCKMLLNTLEWLREMGLLAEPAILLPHWSAMLAFGCLFIALAIIINDKISRAATSKILLGAAIFLLAAGPALRLYMANDKVRLETLDVGQGQALILHFPGRGRVLLDGGGLAGSYDPGKKIVGPYLASNARPSLDGMIASHPDWDHIGGLFHIGDKFELRSLFHNGRDNDSLAQGMWRNMLVKHSGITLSAGDKIILGDPEEELMLEVLHPPRKSDNVYQEWKGNSASLVMRLAHKGVGLALFTGDAEKNTLNHILAQNPDLRSKVVVAPHHGSNRSLVPAFYESASPELVIASCGYRNRWHYPGAKLVNFLKKHDCPIYDTGSQGRISVIFNGNDVPIVESVNGF